MKPEIEIKPVLLEPKEVARMWSVSVKKVYEFINSGELPRVLMPSRETDNRKHPERPGKRLIRIRASVAESWIIRAASRAEFD